MWIVQYVMYSSVWRLYPLLFLSVTLVIASYKSHRCRSALELYDPLSFRIGIRVNYENFVVCECTSWKSLCESIIIRQIIYNDMLPYSSTVLYLRFTFHRSTWGRLIVKSLCWRITFVWQITAHCFWAAFYIDRLVSLASTSYCIRFAVAYSIRFYPMISGSIRFSPILSGFIRFYLGLSDPIRFYPIL